MKLFVLLSFIVTSAASLADTLTMLNWEEYLSEDVVKKWELQSGHKLNQVYFDNDEDRDSIILNHKDNVIDLVIVDEIAAQLLGEKGMFLPLGEYERAFNVDGIDKEQQKTCGSYSVPYLWGTFGLAYRTDKLDLPPRSWDFIFNPPEFMKGHIGLIDDFTDTLAPALIKLERSINTEDQNELRQAFELTKKTLPNVLTFTYSLSFADIEREKDKLYAAIAYSGDQFALNEKYGDEIWDYTTLKEGTILWVDCLAIRKDSPRKEIALDFVNYLYDPKVAAKNSEDVYVATPVPEAKKMQSEEFLTDQTVYPDLGGAQSYEKLSPENTLTRNRITSSLIKLHDSK